MGVDARIVVRARFHENPDRIGVPVHHRVVNRAVFVVLSHVHVHQIGLLAKYLLNPRDIAAPCRLTKICDPVGSVAGHLCSFPGLHVIQFR